MQRKNFIYCTVQHTICYGNETR